MRVPPDGLPFTLTHTTRAQEGLRDEMLDFCALPFPARLRRAQAIVVTARHVTWSVENASPTSVLPLRDRLVLAHVDGGVTRPDCVGVSTPVAGLYKLLAATAAGPRPSALWPSDREIEHIYASGVATNCRDIVDLVSVVAAEHDCETAPVNVRSALDSVQVRACL